ncbi:GNAT family N-acetyltransferase [Aurantiacibacter luteus]|uniref:N-acetyltransferase domain-containing protein n=1 Tax=Aurantiacibacter luteus TaxID=1581420 RepID=A0A0G9MYA6_9SPHN|nr:GNAT family N-acetyltransferase [Aurantiacibacter luteus]KLE35706.1 hypothetical protein AAW00_04745 [Aurantiacibacter luteus]
MTGAPDDLLARWVAARSVARGLPAPVADRGGWRVDTASEAELCRWVFPRVGEGLRELGREVVEPRRLIKLCGTVAELADALPDTWQVENTGAFMRFAGNHGAPALPKGYRLHVQTTGEIIFAAIHHGEDEVASGYGAGKDGAFVFDRIKVDPAHRRRGLASALIAALGARSGERHQLLVASIEGIPLYRHLGWDLLSHYATAQIPARARA